MALVQLENVRVSFRKYQKRESFKTIVHNALLRKNREMKERFFALDDISFTGKDQEIIGIIGSNGAGKTTICRVLSGIYLPDSGSVQVMSNITAMLSLGTGFNQNLSGKENIFLNGMMLGISRKEMNSLYDSIVEFSGIGDFIHEPVKNYSNGMRSRLGFSIASMINPSVLVLDEALNAGDAAFNKIASQRMREMVDRAKLVIVVTHNLDFVRQNCSRAIWIESGKIRKDGNPDKVVVSYEKSGQTKAKLKPKRLLHLTQTVSSINPDRKVAELHNVGIQYKKAGKPFWALQNINLDVHEGEILGVIGHNGAGKSTLCKMLGSILKPDAGSIQVHGETSALLGFGIGFMNELTGRQNIYINGMMLGMSRRQVRAVFQDIVDFSELQDAIDKPVKYYSSGMKSRLGFSIASSLKPEILIIDEALSAGDKAFTEKAAVRIQELIEFSKAVIIVTHSMKFVEKICNRVVVINKGTMVFDGSPVDAVRAYKSA
ncbi:ABC transporter ATP-binding protein [Spirochaeta dissipatitropha]